MHRRVFFKPLLIAVAITALLPSLQAQTETIVTDTGLTLNPYPIDIPAPPLDPVVIAAPCVKPVGHIIQHLCAYLNPPGSLNPFVNATPPHAALKQFEADVVRSWLALHYLPPSDASLVYQSGNYELRSEIRGLMLARLVRIISGKPSDAMEQSVYDWFKYQMWLFERTMYEIAVADKNAWRSNPCTWKPDPDVAEEYGLVYDGSKFCENNNSLNIIINVPPKVPSKAYFLAAAQKTVYGKVFEKREDSTAAAKNAIDIALGGGTGALVGAGVGGGIGLGRRRIWTESVGYTPKHKDAVRIPFSKLARLGLGGPATVVFMMAMAGVEAGFKVFDYEKNVKDMADMDNELAELRNGPSELKRYLGNTPADLNAPGLEPGVLKIVQAFSAVSLPDVVPTTLPVHNSATDPVFFLTPPNTYSETVTYKDPYGSTFSATTYKGWFLRQCLTQCDGVAPTSLMATLEMLDGAGKAWNVTRMGGGFALLEQEPEKDAVLCERLSTAPNPAKCAGYISLTVPFQGPDGNVRTFSIVSQPAFTSGATAFFTQGIPGTFTVTAVGAPSPNIGSADLQPSGFTITPGVGTATIRYDGSALPGTYSIKLLAGNHSTAYQTVTAKVNGAPPEFTSSSVARFKKGVPGAFIVRATGNPAPALTLGSPHFPPLGLDFVDNGDGTATISGTIPVNSPGCGGSECTGYINATVFGNVQTQQSLTIEVVSPVLPSLIPAQLEFTAGVESEGSIVATGSTLGKISNVCTSLPGWLTFKDNGNNTATVSGNPPVGAPSVGLLVIVSPAGVPVQYDCGPTGNGGGSNFTLHVVTRPVITTASIATFTAGTLGSFTVGGVTTDAIAVSGALPAGVTFTPGVQQGTLSGTPAAGTGGVYPLVFTMGTGANAARQDFTLVVKERPAFVEPFNPTFTVNQLGVFPLKLTGYPQKPLTDQDGMILSVSTILAPLPPGISLVQGRTRHGEPTGQWMLMGTPTTIGQTTSLLVAGNGVDIIRGQQFTINVVAAPPVVKPTPVITWPSPAAVTYGSALSATQLNARANVPGSFVYAPPAGTVLPIGSHTLSVTFNPTDTGAYNSATATTNLTINPAPVVPAGKPNLVLTNTLLRVDFGFGLPARIFVRIRIANTGTAAANNVIVSSVKLGAQFGLPLPQTLGTIHPGASMEAIFDVQGVTSPTGTASSLSISGVYTGGTISSNARVTLP